MRYPAPTALKALRGNPGRRPLNRNEPQPRRAKPSMPAWLRAFPVAVREWRREARELDCMGVMTTADAGALAMRAYLGSQIQELADAIRDAGRLVGTTKTDWEGNEVKAEGKTNPLCVQLAKLLPEYRALGSLLGLDPSSRSRLKVERPARPTAVDRFLARKDGGR